MKQTILAGAATVLCMIAASASAATFNEIGDAGQTAATAQDATGFDVIQGSLIDLGGGTADIDFYEILIDDVDAFSVTVTATLSQDNDTELFLFDDLFNPVLSDDDGGAGFLSQFDAGDLSGASAGTYFLAISLYSASAISGGTITVSPSPFQTGPYTLTMTGTADMAPVPLPAAGLMLLAGMGGLLAMRRKT